MTARNNTIDSLRGLACLLLVSYHVIGSDPGAGMKLAEGWLKETNDLLVFYRMPLFTFLSGLVYAYRPFRTGVGQFVKGKARRLLMPMLVVGTLFAALQALIPGTNAQIEHWYLLHLIPVAHFWFVEALFLVFVLIMPLEYLNAFSNKRRTLAVLAAAILLSLSSFGPAWLAIDGAVYLLPYFLLGMAAQRFKLLVGWNADTGWLLLLASLVAVALFKTDPLGPMRSAFAVSIGISGCIGLMLTQIRAPWLAAIGVYSYTIFLFHVFFTAASRVGLNQLGIDGPEHAAWVFCTGLAVGIVGPIIVDRLLSRLAITRLAFLGKSGARALPLSGSVASAHS